MDVYDDPAISTPTAAATTTAVRPSDTAVGRTGHSGPAHAVRVRLPARTAGVAVPAATAVPAEPASRTGTAVPPTPGRDPDTAVTGIDDTGDDTAVPVRAGAPAAGAAVVVQPAATSSTASLRPTAVGSTARPATTARPAAVSSTARPATTAQPATICSTARATTTARPATATAPGDTPNAVGTGGAAPASARRGPSDPAASQWDTAVLRDNR